MKLALELRGVSKSYGRRQALDRLDLAVPEGSVFGLVGSNGAGKTTAMAVALGLLHSDAGDIDVLGSGRFNALRHQGLASLLPQDSRLPPHSRVADLLYFYGRLQGLNETELAASVPEMLEWVHLTDRAGSEIRTLSHGMARRLAVAQAFLGKPKLVLLDEPFNGLDPREAVRARELIRERQHGQTIVISSHHLDDIEALCDTVAFIEKGHLVRQDALETITMRGRQVSYKLLTAEPPPVAKLGGVLGEVKFEWIQAQSELKARFPASLAVEQVNRAVVKMLIDENIGILEIRRGSDLETEYLNSSRPQAVPQPG